MVYIGRCTYCGEETLVIEDGMNNKICERCRDEIQELAA